MNNSNLSLVVYDPVVMIGYRSLWPKLPISVTSITYVSEYMVKEHI